MILSCLLIGGRRHPVVVWLSGLLIAVGLVGTGTATLARGATGAQVDAAIQKAIEFLYSKQKDGNWEMPQFGVNAPKNVQGVANAEQAGGVTALVTYALLAAGESPQDPRILQAIKFLENCKADGIYAIGLRAQVWGYMPLPLKRDIREAIERDGDALLQAAHPDPQFKEIPSAFYRYHLDSKDWDHSCSQYGVLGMWACAEQGYEVPTKYWEAVDAGWRKHQFKDGGWSYESEADPKPAAPKPPAPAVLPPKPSAPMTAAGIATLFITQDFLHGNDGIDCTGNITNPHIKAGLDWMSKNFAQIFKDEGEACYGLYGIERIGAASGYKYFGTTDWFRDGADFLIKHQGAAGAWDGRGGDVANAALGIIFLERGRAPVLMNKLQYEIDQHGDAPKLANWNQRPRDAANLAKWLGKESEGFFNWQIVNLKVPSEQLHDSPILYIAGNQTLDFTPEEIVKLRTFCEDGGLIVVNADCGSRSHGFLQSVLGPKGLGAKLFGDYEFRQLPKDHLIFSNEFRIGVKSQWIEVQGLSNGARELMLVFPNADPARFWQTATYGGRETMHDIMANIYLYVTDKLKPLTKDQTYLVLKDPAIQTTQSLKVARLQYAGNWNPEPGGWRRMAAVLHNDDKIDLTCDTVNLGDGKLGAGYKVAELTGTTKFHLTPAQQDELKKFVTGGGTLIVDAAGGTSDFAGSAEKELAAIFDDQAAKDLTTPLPATDALFTGNGKKIESFGFRSYAMKRLPTTSREPRLRAIKVKNRNAVYYSPEDLSVGMVGQQVDGIYGYTPTTATAIMEHILVQSAAAVVAQP